MLKYNFKTIGNKIYKNKRFNFILKQMDSYKLSNKENTLAYLDRQGISYHVEDHEAANTVEEGLKNIKTDKYKQDEYTFVKNLFIKNKAGGFYLLTANHVNY
jgi:hypothetical protein